MRSRSALLFRQRPPDFRGGSELVRHYAPIIGLTWCLPETGRYAHPTPDVGELQSPSAFSKVPALALGPRIETAPAFEPPGISPTGNSPERA